jgi:transcription elongation GreA/GreB family factor
MRRQRTLERVGWRFWRCWVSTFALDPEGCEADLVATLDRLGIEPLGADAQPRLYTRHRTVRALPNEPPSRQPSPRNGAGITVGDRAAVRFLDDDKVLTLTVDRARHDLVNGVAGAETSLGQALLGLSDEDEGVYTEDGRERRFLVMRIESAGPRPAGPQP